MKVTIWSVLPLPFLNPTWTSGSLQIMYCWSLTWRLLCTTLLPCEMSAIVQYFEHSLAFPFFAVGIKTDLFHFCGHLWIFQICWHIECSTFTASSFRIWNSSDAILSPPLALFMGCLLRPTWLCIPGCLTLCGWSHLCGYLGHEGLFCIVFFFCIFLPPLLNIFCFYWVHIFSVLYCAHLCMKFSPWYLPFSWRDL